MSKLVTAAVSVAALLILGAATAHADNQDTTPVGQFAAEQSADEPDSAIPARGTPGIRYFIGVRPLN
jgi:hypothetical protein